MRLVCPNCDAKYEVPDDAIPDAGRDVQCASCGHAWFQVRAKPATAAQPAGDVSEPASQTEPVAEAPEATPAPVRPEATEAAAEPKQAATKPDEADIEPDEADIEPKPMPRVEAPAESVPASEAAALKPAAAAYAVDESVLAILREEAEREAVARRAEASPLETQTSLGLDTAMPSTPAAALPAVDTETAAKPAARRDLLPDVEEINSTLRPSEVASDEASDEAAAAEQEGRGGFRNGFLLVMAVAILGAAVYIGAPRLSATIPSLAQPLTAYVGAVDAVRLRLDGLMRSATVAINGD
jgi:predicted Zn finger-like uncharacterized protein